MKLTTRVDIFVATDQSFTEFINDLSELATIELVPLNDGSAYRFDNGAIVLTVQPNTYPQLASYPYHLLITGGVYGTPYQRVKWIVDWSLDFYQALKATGRYRLRRVEDVPQGA
jgi:hypothetical protein